MEDIVEIIADLNRKIASYENGSTSVNVSDVFVLEENDCEDNFYHNVDHKIDNRSEQVSTSQCMTSTSLQASAIWSTKIRVFLIVLYCVTLLAALFGNIVVILVQRTARFIHSSPFENIRKYLLNLAVSDIVIGVACAPFAYVDILLGRWIFPYWICPVTQFVQLVSVCVTTLTLMIISVERFCALFYPMSSFYRILKSKSTSLVVCIWALALAYAYIPMRKVNWVEYSSLQSNNISNSNNSTNYQCDSFAGLSGTDRKLLITQNFVLTFALPIIVLTLTYTAIRKNLISNTLNNNQNCRKRISLSKTIKTILIIIVVHGLCWTPIKVYQLLHEFHWITYCTEQQYLTQLYLYTGFHWLAMANCVTNPVVYTFSSQRFRNGIKKIFRSST